MSKTKIFFDCEFTGLHQNTTLISIWLVADTWEEFYAEFNDYDKTQINPWLEKNIIKNLEFNKSISYWYFWKKKVTLKWHSKSIKLYLIDWLRQFSEVEIWSDCLSFDWVLFNNLLADFSNWYPELPNNIYYIPFDICTLFKIKWIDPDISREDYVWISDNFNKHNALFDAQVIKMCYNKLMKSWK